MTTEDTSAPVPGARQRDRTKPAEDVRLRWSWTEPSVWTDRMLTALDEGVKGGRWHTLIDKVSFGHNLEASFAQVASNEGAPGVDHVTVEAFEARRDDELSKLLQELRAGTYRPQAVRRTWIPKPGTHETRPLGIPTVRDRVVQAAVVHVIEPIFERDFAEQSYGFRPGRGCKDALRRVEALLKGGYTHVVDADLKSYFDTIPHDRLMTRLQGKIADRRLLGLVESFLKAGILEGMTEWTPEAGAPQGAVLSPLLSNIYLDPLDHLMADAGLEMVRYADDFVILCRTSAEAARALELVKAWTAEHGLTLHPTKTKIVEARTDGFEFLGYRFINGRRYPRRKSLGKFKDTIREKTQRRRGQSLRTIITDVNATLRGWFGYFKHSHKFVFRALDGWVRMRLRSILRRRLGKRGRGRGADHKRWPNAFFAKHGLYSLVEAHALAVQSSQR
jgi:RNA-directed DNA polymerase